MKTFFYLLPVCFFLQTSLPEFNTATPAPMNRSFFRIGDQLITLEKFNRQTDNNYVMVNLHNDGHFPLQSAMQLVKEQESSFIHLVHTSKRVEADLFDKKIVFDPNTIFTSWGRRLHLKTNKCWSKAADEYLQQFARFVLEEIPMQKTVVMLVEGEEMSVYMTGGSLEKTVKEWHQTAAIDAGYFITGDESIYNELKKEGQKVVLQYDRKLEDDGSLPVFCAKSNRSYLKLVNGQDASDIGTMMEVMHKVLK